MALHRVVRDVLNCVRATLYFFGSLPEVSYAAFRSAPSSIFLVKPAAHSGGIAGLNGNSHKVQREKKSATTHTGPAEGFPMQIFHKQWPFFQKSSAGFRFFALKNGF